MSFLDEIRMTARYTRGLPAFLRQPLSPEACRRLIRERLAARSDAFLTLVEQGIFNNPKSPYRALFDWAGIGFPEVSRLTAGFGVEGALEKLRDAGVSAQLAEFKGRRAGCCSISTF